MKALLLKDWYMTVRYGKSYLPIVAVFAAISAVSRINFFYGFYACIMMGMLPVTLLSYDERNKWTVYSLNLPYTRRQLVGAKYIVGGFSQLAVMVLLGVIQGVRMGIKGSFNLSGVLGYMSLLLFMSCLVCAVNLPFVFKCGVEKGRIWYYVMLVLVFGTAGVLSAIYTMTNIGAGSGHMAFGGMTPLLLLAGLAAYALSWRLSISFYEKREM